MKQLDYLVRFFVFLAPLLAIEYGCQQKSSHTESAQTTDSLAVQSANQPDTLCFRQIVGRDSTLLQLVRNGSSVTGELAILPFEKDRARGSIKGIQTGQQITADWQRSGEGITQTYEVIFTLKGDSIIWREGERIEKQGKWILKDPSQSYEYVLMKTNCQY
ncbi:hypothetical protein [Spirosoma gilvum]